MADIFVFTFILLIKFTGIFAASYCVNYDPRKGEQNELWCDYGCCGSQDEKCCDSPIGKIVGIVVGCIIFVALAVTVIVIIIYCSCRSPRGQRGQVSQPAAVQATTVHMQSPMPYGQVSYSNAVNTPVTVMTSDVTPGTVMTSNVTPGTTQSWQQPVSPPKYEEVVKNQ